MNRWRRKRRMSVRTNPKVNQDSVEEKVAKNDVKNDLLRINEEEIGHLAKNDPNYRE